MNSRIAVLALSLVFVGCEIGRTASTIPATSVCLAPDSGRPELGLPFSVRASPGFDLDGGCTVTADGGVLSVVVSGIDVSFFPHSDVPAAPLTCAVPPLAPGSYFVAQSFDAGFSFGVGPDAGFSFPLCP